jgi:uncharacterized protein (TIGR02611 family)
VAAPGAPLPTPRSGEPGGGRPERPTIEERRAQYAEDGTHSLRERVAESGWRRRIAARRSIDRAYRVGVGIVGGLIVAVGLAAIPLPGPGWFIVFAGLFVLGSEFFWAERLLEFARAHVTAWTEWIGRQPIWVRGLIALATAAFVYGVLVLTLHLFGVPGWAPGWVPLWH